MRQGDARLLNHPNRPNPLQNVADGKATGPRAEAGLPGRERKPGSRIFLNIRRGLVGETRFPPRLVSPTFLVADVNVVVVIGQRERGPAETEQ